ncbi:50S ribosomal protein L15 [Candidatus Woesearchaeota archaeon CG10_big_fil_rev_8_21_14_0_10_34_8]|nr:MAG: 50S ribosomal protein L15 [Candidatus Woesearchaeota archaeon CG10_big_fil_rev_8_21_14_0_10_34_8]
MKIKRKKVTRQRARTTHSFGSMKKHRGYGNKGGKGNAGSGKRGDCKKPSYWAIKRYYGKFGFNSVQRKQIETCNIQQLEMEYQKLLKQGVIKDEKGVCSIDLSAIGVQKLLSKGSPSRKWTITVKLASASALEKIKEKGGNVVLDKKEASPEKAE